MAKNVDDLLALTTRSNLAPVHMVGHSYGGFIAAYFAYQHPDLVRSLILVEPGITTLFIRNPNSLLDLLGFLLRYPSLAIAAIGFALRTQDAVNAFQDGDAEKGARLFVDEIQARTNAFEELPGEARKMMTENANSLLDVRIVPPEFTRAEASNIHTRTMIIKGGTTHKLLRAIATALSHCLPDCELVTIPGAGHFSHIEKPEEFNSLARRFLSSVT